MTSSPSVRVEARGLSKQYRSAAGWWKLSGGVPIHAVDGVDLTIGAGEILGLVGESGSGKSTLARLLLRLDEPDTGSLHFEGQDLLALKGRALRARRRDFQIVFQDPYGSLNPRMKVGEIVGEPRRVHRMDADRNARGRKVAGLLERVGLDPAMVDRYPHEFSGGQRQRIGIARAIASEPKFLIADEPVSALDPPVQAQIVNLLMQLQETMGLALLFVAHDLRLIRRICDRVAVMYAGRIVEVARTKDLFSSPAHPYTQGLLAATPSLDPSSAPVRGLAGEPPDPARRPSGCPFHPRCPERVEECGHRAPQWVELEIGHRVDCRLEMKPIIGQGRT